MLAMRVVGAFLYQPAPLDDDRGRDQQRSLGRFQQGGAVAVIAAAGAVVILLLLREPLAGATLHTLPGTPRHLPAEFQQLKCTG